MTKKMLDLLYRSFDKELSLEEQRDLDRALENSQELKSEKQQIESLRSTLSGSQKQSFKPFFAERVANCIVNLNNPAKLQQDFFESLNYIFKRVLIAGSVATLILFSVNMMNKNTNPAPQTQVSSEVTLEEDIFASYLTSMEDVL